MPAPKVVPVSTETHAEAPAEAPVDTNLKMEVDSVSPIDLLSGKSLLANGPTAFYEQVATKLQVSTGHCSPQVEIRFRDLSFTVDVLANKRKVGDTQLPTLPNVLRHKFDKLVHKNKKYQKFILRNVSGMFRPGTMTLLLGQPGSGKSVFMKILSGHMHMTKSVHLQGAITYNGLERQQLIKQLPLLVAYVAQRDHHFPTLTVKETLAFAHQCCGGDLAKQLQPLLTHGTAEQNLQALETIKALVKFHPDLVIQSLGLGNCQNTVIGNGMLRGVSGGERKRVTSGEMEFGKNYAVFMDEVTTGLDSAAAFDILSMHRDMVRKLRRTVVMSVLQPSPEIFDLFDDVMILNEGQVMYHGPRAQVIEYFTGLGFHCPVNRDPADFLMDLGTKNQSKYENEEEEDETTTQHPRNATEFAEVFRQSEIHKKMLHQLDQPLASTITDHAKRLDEAPEFHQPLVKSTAVLLARQMKVFWRNKPFLIGRCIMVPVMGLLYSTTFYHFDPTDVQVILGIIFFSIMFTALGQVSQLPAFMQAREIFYKQRAANFYRTSSYVFASSVSRLPLSLTESIFFCLIVYWMCGFVHDGKAFVVFVVIVFLSNLVFGALFFLLTAIAPDLHVVKPLANVTVLFSILSSGFIISPESMPGYFIWVYWISPVAWAFRALAINQFMNDAINLDKFRNVDYMKYFHKHMGEYFLDLFGLPHEQKWVFAGAFYLVGFYMLMLFLAFLALEFKRHDHTTSSNEGNNKPFRSTESHMSTHSLVVIRKMFSSRRVAPTKPKNFVPVTLAFQDLWYSVPTPGKPHEQIALLKGVSGYALPGTMTALMGSSGAGKTTLMDVIAGRKTSGKIQGKILLNGYPATQLVIRRATGYCEQMDVHSEGATFREALVFSAFLRQDSTVSDKIKYESVDECLELLELKPIADKIIRGSTVEQMKRLTIGVELAAQPSVLFLDEPTSGLDARSAKMIMDGVRKVAGRGRTVVCTIHQPSMEVFQVFDNLLLLKRGGETVFFGELGKNCNDLVNYFERIDGVKALPKNYNPATWMLEVIGAGVDNHQTVESKDKDFVKIFQQSDQNRALEAMLAKPGVTHPTDQVPEIKFATKRAATHWTQCQFLMVRFFQMYWRTASYNLTRFFIMIFLALLFGLVYLRVEYDTFSGIISGVGMIFMTTTFLGVVAMNGILPIMSEDRPAYYRERACQTYNSGWYFLASTIVEIPYVFVCCLAFTSIFFPMVSFTGAKAFVLYWIDTSVHVLCQCFLGQLLVFVTPSVEVAAILGIFVNALCILFMGFSPPAAKIPSAYKWFHYIVPQHYVLSFLVADVLGDCSGVGGVELGCQIIKDAPGVLANISIKAYLEAVYQIQREHMWRDLAITIGIVAVLRLVALVALWNLSFQKR